MVLPLIARAAATLAAKKGLQEIEAQAAKRVTASQAQRVAEKAASMEEAAAASAARAATKPRHDTGVTLPARRVGADKVEKAEAADVRRPLDEMVDRVSKGMDPGFRKGGRINKTPRRNIER